VGQRWAPLQCAPRHRRCPRHRKLLHCCHVEQPSMKPCPSDWPLPPLLLPLLLLLPPPLLHWDAPPGASGGQAPP